MKILFIASYAPSLVNFRGPLILSLLEKGISVHAAVPMSSDSEQILSSLRNRGVIFHHIPLQRVGLNPLADFKLFIRLISLLGKLRPSRVLPYTIKPVVYAGIAFRFFKCWNSSCISSFYPLITGLGFAFSNTTRPGIKALVQKFILLLLRQSLKASSCIIFQNSDDKNLLISLKVIEPSVKTAIVGGSGVDLSIFQSSPLPVNASFLMLSRVLVDKGVREFVEAAKIVKKVYPNVAFSYGGFLDSSNPASISESEFRSWIDSDIFEYLGDLSSNDVIIALNKCKFYVLPSYREGTPRSVLEAMALGRPILTTDVPGCRETVVDGLNGFLVPARDPDALANGMIRLIKQPEEDTFRMASESLKLVKARFDVRKVNAQIIGLLCL